MSIKNLKTESFVYGEWVSAVESFPVLNPATGEKICDVSNTNLSMLEDAIMKAKQAQILWAETPTFERADILLKWRDLIVQNKDDLAHLLTTEQGKPLSESYAEIGRADNIRWAAEESVRLYDKIAPPFKRNIRAEILYQPMGIVAAITPWNFPHSMITRKVAPALAAGCAVILKPAEDTPLSALALADLADKAGLPKGLFSVIPCARDRAAVIGEALLSDTRIAKLSFTGSTVIGKKLMGLAAKTVKNISLELGGNAPFIITESADQTQAIKALIASKFRNAGQTCICANRVYIHRKIFTEIKSKLQNEIDNMRMGNGMDEGTIIGPLINPAACNKMDDLVADAKDKGAEIISSVSKPESGNFYSPTIISNMTDEMKIMQDEIFGPLLVLIPFETDDEVIRKANATNYGLAAYLHSRDTVQADKIARALDYGMVAVNESSFIHPSLPFGGMKESGIGREGGPDSLKEFLEAKYIVTGF